MTLGVLLGFIFMVSATAATDDTLIKQIFFQDDGSLVIETVDPLVNASKERTCEQGQAWTNHLAQVLASTVKAENRIVKGLLYAEAHSIPIRLETSGCFGHRHIINAVTLLK